MYPIYCSCTLWKLPTLKELIHSNLQIISLWHSHIVWSKNSDNCIAHLMNNATDCGKPHTEQVAWALYIGSQLPQSDSNSLFQRNETTQEFLFKKIKLHFANWIENVSRPGTISWNNAVLLCFVHNALSTDTLVRVVATSQSSQVAVFVTVSLHYTLFTWTRNRVEPGSVHTTALIDSEKARIA